MRKQYLTEKINITLIDAHTERDHRCDEPCAVVDGVVCVRRGASANAERYIERINERACFSGALRLALRKYLKKRCIHKNDDDDDVQVTYTRTQKHNNVKTH